GGGLYELRYSIGPGLGVQVLDFTEFVEVYGLKPLPSLNHLCYNTPSETTRFPLHNDHDHNMLRQGASPDHNMLYHGRRVRKSQGAGANPRSGEGSGS
ncbi:MAG TPA: hypothetical protein VER55_12590, partial [Ardenticatenaceae bacterium]|nr:hypothetical protein [Ardenticatenaceae bacterium]